MHHRLDASALISRWDRHATPVLTIDSGDTVTYDCPEPCGQVTPDWTTRDLAERWDADKVHALLGPVDVRGTKAGGSIDVQILDIQHHGWGWSALIPRCGLIHDRFPEPYLHQWTLTDAGCDFRVNNIVIPFRPFIGCLGVAPLTDEVLHSTLPPRDNAGNLDLNDLTVGATVRLPVFRDGAGVCLGDGHAAQGDGELSGTAIEAPLTVTARLTARPDTPADGVTVTQKEDATLFRPSPRFTTTAVGPDPRAAARQATHRMVDRLAAGLDLPDPQAMILCSAVGDLRIAQAVNEPNWTIALSVPADLLAPGR